MIIGSNRETVIKNIQRATEKGTLNIKVEVDDPVLTAEQRENMLKNYLKKRVTVKYRINKRIARLIANNASSIINHTTKIIGIENVDGITGGAILTSNHFSQIDNTVVRTFVRKIGKKKLCIVSQETNLAMTGWVGFMLNYADTIPISSNNDYMSHQFMSMMKEALDTNNYVLIYPEQEMWFNYRKPRPLKRGAYYYAAFFNVPIISCFVEIRDLDEVDTQEFHKIQYTIHILQPIFPDPAKTVRENSFAMRIQDYQRKKAAYETAYGKPLDYHFEPNDIAGWISSSDIEEEIGGLQEIYKASI